MAHHIDLTKASIYVGTYHKYNEGSLFGEWMNLSDYNDKDEFYDACRELHKDEEDPEFMFQDYENIPDDLVGESWMSGNLFEVLSALANISENHIEPFLIWCNNGHRKLSEEDIDDLINSFQDDYVGEYDSEEDFARELIELREDLTDFAIQYFDYEAYANDLFCSDYWCEDGHVFYNT